MIIDAPNSIAKAILALEDLESFVIRYTDTVLRTVVEVHNTAEKMKTNNKETRDGVLSSLLERVNKIIIGETPEDYKPWPLVQMAPLPIGLMYRSQLIYLLAKDEINADDVVNFVNVVYFPVLRLDRLKAAIFANGNCPNPNDPATHVLILDLASQATLLASSELAVNPATLETEAL